MAVDLDIAQVREDEIPLLEQLYQLYLYDFSPYLELDVDERGRFDDGVVPADYLKDDDKEALFLRVGEKVAGFALLDRDCELLEEPEAVRVAEFSVLLRYRRQGLGRGFARALVRRHPGWWEASIVDKNEPAKAFWRQVVKEFTPSSYREQAVEADDGSELFVFWRVES
jgi:predicted acetyltransferase